MMNELARYEFNILVALIHMQNSCWLQKMIRKIQFICLLLIHHTADSLNPIFIIFHDENKDDIENNGQAPTD